MVDYLSVIGFAAGLAMLIWGADLFTDAVVDTAKKFRVSTLMLALLVAGAEPEELLASAIAAGKGMHGIAVGNVLGTNIAIIGLALALGAIIMPITSSKPSQRHGIIVLAFSLPPIFLMLNGSLARWEGIVLVLLFLVYVWYVVQKEKIEIELEEVTTAQLLDREVESGDQGDDDNPAQADFRLARQSKSELEELPQTPQVFENAQDAREDSEDDHDDDNRPTWKVVSVIIFGMALMAAGGELLVGGAGSIMQWLNLSETVVGLTFVSIATSAEMIVLSIVPVFKGHPEITTGGIIGSYAYNVILTFGVAAIVRPLAVPTALLAVDLPIMVGFYALLLIFAFKGNFTRANGIMLLLPYLAYLFYNFAVR